MTTEPDDVSQRTTQSPTFTGLIVGLLVFCSVSACVMYLGYQSQLVNRDNLDTRLRALVLTAATLVDIERHQQLRKPEDTNSSLYAEIITPLVEMHNAVDGILYLYTMIEHGQQLVFILDTANDPRLKQDGLVSSPVMEAYNDPQVDGAWIMEVKSGNVYIDTEPVVDDFGPVISATAPLYDRQGEFVGLISIDISAQDFIDHRQQIQGQVVISLGAGLVLSIFIAALVRANQLELRALRQQQYLLVITDALTGAYNRRFYATNSAIEMERYSRYQTPLSLVAIDIDHFKQVNDLHGHDVGDLVLQGLVKLILTAKRNNDYLVRMGGEEFTLILPNTDAASATRIVKRLLALIAEMPFECSNGATLNITISAGISEPQAGDADIDDIAKRADEALYQAKREGRNRYVVAPS